MSHLTSIRQLATAAVSALAILLLAGCWQDRLVWSPDGTRAAIITKDGLQFCDAGGKLTPLLAPGVYRAAWLADSRRLVLARSRPINDYATLAALLGPERSRALANKAEIVWREWQSSPKGEFNSAFGPDDDLGAIVVYLREHYGEALRKKAAEDPSDDPHTIDELAADWHSIVVARLDGDRLEMSAPLMEGLTQIQDLRPAPSGSAVAFVSHLELSGTPGNVLGILVEPTGGSALPVLVASYTAAHPDWTPDSRALVYLKSATDHAAGSDLQLGALVERGVLDAAGHIHLAEKPEDLAGLIFQENNRVRCLRDGRILFDAAEFHLPLAESGHTRGEQLFALDRTKASPVLSPLIRADQFRRVPNELTSFEISPDEKQVLFPDGANVEVLTLASGGVDRLALGAVDDSSDKTNPPLPAWRRAGELCYLKKIGSRTEVVLRAGNNETILSRSWPDEVLARLIQ